jgi:hypothetical protein
MTKIRFCPSNGWREMCPFPCVSSTRTAFPELTRLTSLSIARFEFHLAVQPYGEESTRWCVKGSLAYPGGDVNKADA